MKIHWIPIEIKSRIQLFNRALWEFLISVDAPICVYIYIYDKKYMCIYKYIICSSIDTCESLLFDSLVAKMWTD